MTNSTTPDSPKQKKYIPLLLSQSFHGNGPSDVTRQICLWVNERPTPRKVQSINILPGLNEGWHYGIVFYWSEK